MSNEHKGRRTLPDDVEKAEKEYVKRRRGKARLLQSELESEQPVGIALSGGGIRSATFSLGILQELARKRVLPLADYLCTVSGGGYLGACLSSLMSKASDLKGKSWQDGKKDFGIDENFPLHDVDQIHHLRKHGDFLILRKGFIRRDVLRAIGTILIGVVCTVGLFLLFMAGTASLFVAFTELLAGPELWTDAAMKTWKPSLDIVGDNKMWSAYSILAGTGFVASIIPCFLLFLYAVLTETANRNKGSTGETGMERGQRFILWAFFLFVFVLAGAIGSPKAVRWWVGTEGGTDPTTLQALLQPFAYSVGTGLALLLFYTFFAVRFSVFWKNTRRSLLGAMQGICLYSMLVSLMLPALVLAIYALKGYVLSAGMSGVISLFAARVFAKHQPAKLGADAGLWRKAVAAAPTVVLALAVVVLIASVFLLFCSAAVGQDIDHLNWGMSLVFGSLAIGSFLDFNRISPHYFYRDRLAETYLRTEAQKDGELKIVRDDYNLKIRDLHECADDSTAGNPAPYHLIMCSLNLPGSRDLARKDRRSDHFVFSQEYCGSSTTGYVPTKKYRKGKTKLCTAMTISGAAASSMMGFYTSFGQAFAMTLFNIRLGFWLVNPRIYREREYYVETERSHTDLKAGWFRSAVNAGSCLEKAVFWPLYLYREFTASGDAQHQLVNLSDGGHTGDNLGIYPLLQRRCKLIIACDGEADPEYNFGSLTAAMRQIYTDENVIVDFKLMDLKPNESGGRPKSHYLIGKVRYPQCEDASGRPTSKESTGWIICLKSSLVMKEEPATVIGYASKNEDFPHQSTADQFFDDDQFEAYRALGEHIARTMLDDSGLAANTEGKGGGGVTTGMLVKWCESKFA